MMSSLDALLARAMADDELIAAMQAGMQGLHRFRDAMPHIPYGYTRTLLRKSARFELVAMRWAPGSVSPIHDHGLSRCWVVMLEGTLDIDNYERLDDGASFTANLRHTSQTRLAIGDLDHRLDWRELHRVRNAAVIDALSLQIYAAPQVDFTIVDEATMECRRSLPKYDVCFEL